MVPVVVVVVVVGGNFFNDLKMTSQLKVIVITWVDISKLAQLFPK